MEHTDLMTDANTLPVLFFAIAIGSLFYQAISFSKSGMNGQQTRNLKFPALWRKKLLTYWSGFTVASMFVSSILENVSKHFLFRHEDLVESYLQKKGLKTLHRPTYLFFWRLFHLGLFIEAMLLLSIFVALFFLERPYLSFIDIQPYLPLAPKNNVENISPLWLIYFSPILLHIFYLIPQLEEKIFQKQKFKNKSKQVELKQNYDDPRIKSSYTAQHFKNFKKMYANPLTFLFLIFSLYCTLILTVVHILLPLTQAQSLPDDYYQSSRNIFTAFMVSSMAIYATWSKNADSRFLFERCKFTFFNPLTTCFLVAILLCFSILICVPADSVSLSVLALLLVAFLFLINLIYRPTIVSTPIQSLKVALYLSVLIASIFSLTEFLLELRVMTYTKISLASIAMVSSACFGLYWHHRWNAPRELNAQKGVKLALDSRKQEMMFDSVTQGNDIRAAGLLALGVSPELQDKKGDFLLHIAVKNGHSNIIYPLLKFGADINSANKLKLRPIHVAASHVNFEILQVLIDEGADPNVKDMHGKTPLHRLCSQSQVIADDNQQTQLVKKLLDQGVDPLEKDKLGTSSYDLAKKWNAKKITDLMNRYIKN